MSLQPLIASVVAALLLSAAAMTYGVATDARLITVGAAMLFSFFVMTAAWLVNRSAWFATGEARTDLHFHTMRRNTRLAALVYAWGAAAFFAIYGLTNIRWQHGLQYGTAATLIAAALLYFVHRMGNSSDKIPPGPALTVLHGGAVAAGLVFLIASDKIMKAKGDWPANYIFLFGGMAIVVICYFALITQIRLRKT